MNENIPGGPADEPTTFAPPPPEGPAQVQSARRKVDPLFLALGILTPLVLYPIGVVVAGSLPQDPSSYTIFAPTALCLWGVLPLLILVGSLVLFIVGRTRGNERLRSFGLGGLIACAATLLLGLLAFGTCFLALGTGGLMG